MSPGPPARFPKAPGGPGDLRLFVEVGDFLEAATVVALDPAQVGAHAVQLAVGQPGDLDRKVDHLGPVRHGEEEPEAGQAPQRGAQGAVGSSAGSDSEEVGEPVGVDVVVGAPLVGGVEERSRRRVGPSLPAAIDSGIETTTDIEDLSGFTGLRSPGELPTGPPIATVTISNTRPDPLVLAHNGALCPPTSAESCAPNPGSRSTPPQWRLCPSLRCRAEEK